MRNDADPKHEILGNKGNKAEVKRCGIGCHMPFNKAFSGHSKCLLV